MVAHTYCRHINCKQCREKDKKLEQWMEDNQQAPDTQGPEGSALNACSVTKASLLDMFKDHYWDTFEDDRDLIIAHITEVLNMYDFKNIK